MNNRTDATSCGSAGLPPPVGGDPPQAASSTTPRALSGSRVRIVPIMYTRLRSAGFLVLVYPRTCDAAFRDTSGQARDRKSTRLNSSHSQISYAVFCLKKKKKNKSYRQDVHT